MTVCGAWGIPEKAFVRADALSGGQQQRVGIARALAQEPSIMLADEPVASLDPPTSHAVLSDLKRISREDGITTIVNLHFIDMAREYADRIVGMRDGVVVFDGTPEEASNRVFEEIYGRPIDREKDLRGCCLIPCPKRAPRRCDLGYPGLSVGVCGLLWRYFFMWRLYKPVLT